MTGAPRVLIIDDTEVNRALTARQIKKLGFEADLAAGGAAALELLCRHSYALILVDQRMPEMDGFEFVALLREREAGASERTRVVMLTAERPVGTAAMRLQQEFDGCLLKPVTLAQLSTVLPVHPAVRAEHPLDDAADAAAPIDVAQLARLMGDTSLATMRHVTVDFCRAFAGLETRLAAAAAGRDRARLAELAHTGKGAAATVAAPALADVMARLMALAATASWPQLDGLIEIARDEFRRVRHWTEALPET